MDTYSTEGQVAFVKVIPADALPVLIERCACPAYSFTHLKYHGDCEGVPRRDGDAVPYLEAA